VLPPMTARMPPLMTSRYRAAEAVTRDDIAQVVALRTRVFRTARGRPGPEADAWDPRCRHVVITENDGGAVVGGFRLLPLSGAEIHTSYSAQFHDVTELSGKSGWFVEVGRFCVAPEVRDPDVMRLALASMLLVADGATALFGCASFPGADITTHHAALSYLAAHHLAPGHHSPGTALQHDLPPGGAIAGPAAFAPRSTVGPGVDLPSPDPEASPAGLPPLLRAYLGLGARVSGRAAIDRDLDTLHVLVTLDVADIPPARLRSLRALAHAAAVPG
jgi:L-ornithine Nalpha-acyltransferase